MPDDIPTTERFRFPAHLRLKSPAEFKAVYDRKKSASDDVLIVYAAENGRPHPRLGVSVSRKVGNAVVRNRYKRLFREAFRLTRPELPAGVDLVLIPRPQAGAPTLNVLKASLLKLAHLAAKKLASEGRQPPVGEPQQGADAPRSPGEPAS
ncbi:MAG TPA: ribonuclease P protein component [Fimbriiglobus sp.]|nr:ribonuclease P protein component [Fimbriiglobus sp.]